MNNLIVFCVGVVVSILVIYGMFTQVVSEMYKARESEKLETQD
ncbi:MAG: hypothetical protein AAB288_07280 [Acidobacteriota bacterium]